ncbi:type II toxin-antitoxin system RelB/DinJ family antitoxin [Peptoniphilus sp. EMRHCC_23]|uniref:type II toxin-antitoxin system RelB/DinJ family antitoxin n=1 Tax=Peptoniphilus rachelemmaiella TaxID=2811779 RepID=UPI001C008141|nr:type II toxin-antitoxin system RelB/DinJ family antitoxin [Peptoniphilus rachelemmaiella]
MAKSAIINVRMVPAVKSEAEAILKEIGLAPSAAIELFYRQIILKRGLPFSVVLPEPSPDVANLSKEALLDLLREGIRDLEVDRSEEASAVFSRLLDERSSGIRLGE